MQYTISINDAGKRFDVFLKEKIENKSRSAIQKAIQKGSILVNGETKKTHYVLKEGDSITMQKKIKKHDQQKPTLDIIFEDNNVLVINKPAGCIIDGEFAKSILPYLDPEMQQHERPGIVHRLDKDTSGVLVIGKNEKAMQFLMQQFKERKMEKKYFALVKGHIYPKKGSIEAPLTRSAKNRKKIMVSASKKARFALTHYETMKEFQECSLLQVQIVTGRTHQIRVHFAAIHHPIVGDKTYGNQKFNSLIHEKTGLDRQFLHAASIAFKNISTHVYSEKDETMKKQKFDAKLPEDLKKTLDILVRL
jgi:23S rRNA pseudouridine1911/1915/1917 synthase